MPLVVSFLPLGPQIPMKLSLIFFSQVVLEKDALLIALFSPV